MNYCKFYMDIGSRQEQADAIAIGRQTWQSRYLDSFTTISEDKLCCVVCDGMGGRDKPELSNHICKSIASLFEERNYNSCHDLKDMMISAHNSALEIYQDCGAALAILALNHDVVSIASIGDCAIHGFKNDTLIKLTPSQSVYNFLLAGIGPIFHQQNIQDHIFAQDFPISLYNTFTLCSDGILNSGLITLLGSNMLKPPFPIEHALDQTLFSDNASLILINVS